MQTTFDFSENDLVRFTCGDIKGGIYIHTDPILISINGPYPLEDVSEETLENCAHIVRDDFLTFTGFKNKAFNVIAKRLESSGQCFVYSFLFDPQGECHRDKQPIEAVLDQIAPEQVLGGEMCKGFLVKLDENRLWAFEPIHHFFACAIVAYKSQHVAVVDCKIGYVDGRLVAKCFLEVGDVDVHWVGFKN